MNAERLLLLCHHGGWDHLYQAGSCAATAAALGWRVDVVFYFGALDKLITGRLDEVSLEPRDATRERELAARIDELGTRGPASLFATAREAGSTQFLACSASLALLGHEPSAAHALGSGVDEVIGWPTTLSLLSAADRVLYL